MNRTLSYFYFHIRIQNKINHIIHCKCFYEDNSWCLFPPLCFVDASSGIVPEESKEDLENTLTDEEFSIVSDNDSNLGFQLKFKILEILNNTGLLTAKK